MNKTQKDLRLLPYRFKNVAYGLLLLTFVFILFTLLDIVVIEKETAKTLSSSGILLALLLLALTSDRIEDELTLRIRVKAFAASFIYGVTYVVVMPFINLIFDGDFITDNMGMEGLLFTMFLFYFGMFGLMKKHR